MAHQGGGYVRMEPPCELPSNWTTNMNANCHGIINLKYINCIPLDSFLTNPLQVDVNANGHTIYNAGKIFIGSAVDDGSGALLQVTGEINAASYMVGGVEFASSSAPGRIDLTNIYSINGQPPSTGGAAAQSPWLTDINAADHTLYNVQAIGVGVANPAFNIDSIGSINAGDCYFVAGVEFACTDGLGGIDIRNVSTVNGNPVGAPDYSTLLEGTCISIAIAPGPPQTATISANVYCIQSPWQGDIDAEGHALNDVSSIGINTPTSSSGTIQINGLAGSAGIQMYNNLGANFQLTAAQGGNFIAGNPLEIDSNVGIRTAPTGNALDVAGTVNSTGCYLINDIPFACPNATGGIDITNVSNINGIAPGGAPAGINGQVQFNNNGSFGADANLSWDSTTATLDTVNLDLNGAAPRLSFDSPTNDYTFYLNPGSGYLNLDGSVLQLNNSVIISGGILPYALDVNGDVHTTGCYYIGGPTTPVALCNDGSGNLLVNGAPVSGGGASVIVGDTPPATPKPGDLWFDSTGTQLYIWYTDPTSSQWVATINQCGLIGDAPADGSIYGRSNNSWTIIPPVTPACALQTPWLCNIDGANYTLSNVQAIGVGRAAFSPYTLIYMTTANSVSALRFTSTNTTAKNAVLDFNNDVLFGGGILNPGSAYPAPTNYRSNVVWWAAHDFIISTNNDSTERMRITQPGLVGINTSVPAYQLDVNGPLNSYVARFTNAGTFTGVIIDHTDTPGGESILSFRSGGVESAVISYDSDEDAVIIWTGNRDAGLSTLTCDTNSNVGINSTSPRCKLDVTGMIRTTDLGLVPIDGAGLEMFYDNVNSKGLIDAYDRGALTYERLEINGSSLTLQMNGGKVGIGTANPQVLLDMPTYNTTNSTVRIGSMELSGYSLNNSFITDNLYFNGTSFVYRNTGVGAVLGLNHGDLEFSNAPSGTAGTSASNVVRLMVTPGGNVGIGTTSVTYPLQVENYYSALDPGLTMNATGPLFGIGVPGNVELVFGWQGAAPYGYWLQVRGNTPRPLLLNPSGGSVGIGTTNPNWSNSLQVRVGPNANLGLGGGVSVGGAVAIQVGDDVFTTLEPLEIRSSGTHFTSGNVMIPTMPAYPDLPSAQAALGANTRTLWFNTSTFVVGVT